MRGWKFAKPAIVQLCRYSPSQPTYSLLRKFHCEWESNLVPLFFYYSQRPQRSPFIVDSDPNDDFDDEETFPVSCIFSL